MTVIQLSCSYKFYPNISPIAKKLEELGYEVQLPNNFTDPNIGEKVRNNPKTYSDLIERLLKESKQLVEQCDAILVVNLNKEGKPNYLGGGTFVEVYEAFRAGKPIFFWNPLPDCIFTDELKGMKPIIIDRNLDILVDKL